MVKHLAKEFFYQLPSGNEVHPSRLIHRDGTIMWKHALACCNELVALPECEAHEQHIIKTASRLEELNTWVSKDLDPWEFLKPMVWYTPNLPVFDEGISVLFEHTSRPTNEVFSMLQPHIQEHEELSVDRGWLFFRRC